MLFSNLLVAIALTVLFPLGLMGVLAASEWLERRTLAAEDVLPRRLRRMDAEPPEAVEAMVLEETAQVVAQYWSATGRPASEARRQRRPAQRRHRPDHPRPGQRGRAPSAPRRPRPGRPPRAAPLIVGLGCGGSELPPHGSGTAGSILLPYR